MPDTFGGALKGGVSFAAFSIPSLLLGIFDEDTEAQPKYTLQQTPGLLGRECRRANLVSFILRAKPEGLPLATL